MFKKLSASQRSVAVVGAVIFVIVLWALFRPELLFVKKSVDEPLPGATSSIGSAYRVAALPRILSSAV